MNLKHAMHFFVHCRNTDPSKTATHKMKTQERLQCNHNGRKGVAVQTQLLQGFAGACCCRVMQYKNFVTNTRKAQIAQKSILTAQGQNELKARYCLHFLSENALRATSHPAVCAFSHLRGADPVTLRRRGLRSLRSLRSRKVEGGGGRGRGVKV